MNGGCPFPSHARLFISVVILKLLFLLSAGLPGTVAVVSAGAADQPVVRWMCVASMALMCAAQAFHLADEIQSQFRLQGVTCHAQTFHL